MQAYKIDCGKTTISLSVFDTGIPLKDGPTVVITAGMDGDEYTGMETAKRLIRKFSRESVLCGRIIIFPLVNVSGYTAKTSINPHDNVYPKHIYPGNKNGSESERIIAWMTTEYLNKARVWIDLHSGDTHEKLKPFVWGYQTGVAGINTLAKRLLQVTGAERSIYQKNFRWGKVEHLAKKGCAYVVFE
jgi:predicted deacylase